MNQRPASRRSRPSAVALALLVCLGLALPTVLSAQSRTMLGFRAGGGIDGLGKAVSVGQIEVTELAGSSSVEVAVYGLGELETLEDYSFRPRSVLYTYHEELSVWGVGVTANYLFRHSLEGVGPYFLLGIGVGPLHVDRTRTSPNDLSPTTPLPGGGSFEHEDGFTLGPLLSAGVGLRLHSHFDVRAQAQWLLVPSSDRREDLVALPTFTLATGAS